MSSPLSMLNKARRPPPQGLLKEHRFQRTGSLKRSLLQGFRTEQKQEGRSDTHASPSTNTSVSDAFRAKAKCKDARLSDSELMSGMMERLSQLEETAESQTREIECKDKRIADLQERLRAGTGSGAAQREREDLEKKCHQLQKQVHEMEAFLSDYGLIWVGESDDSADCDPVIPANQHFQVNFDLVLRRIRELNVLVGKGESFVQSTPTGARLATREPIELSLYSNGFVMLDGPLRSYEDPSTQECLQDIMDGFFPSELQDRFPDGIPFQVEDRRDEKFIPKLQRDTFPGEGRAVRGQRRESQSGVGAQMPDQMLTPDEPLTRPPRLVVKDGQLMDIRSSGLFEDLRSSSVVPIVTPALQVEQTERSLPSPPKVITLKVRSEDGNQSYMLKMFPSDTIGQLRMYLDQHREEGLSDYDIITAHPQHHFDSNAETLQSCGLTANATLLLQKRKQQGKL